MTDPAVTITRIGLGMFRVQHDGRSDIVYVTGRGADRWIFWNGHVFRGGLGDGDTSLPATGAVRAAHAGSSHTLSAPMPARVVQVLVRPGASVRKGDTVVLLEAMKMELPVRALADAKIVAVHCRDGELVEADAPLVDLT